MALARTEVPLILRRSHPMAHSRKVAVRAGSLQTWMSLSSYHPSWEAARIAARLIRQMAARKQEAN